MLSRTSDSELVLEFLICFGMSGEGWLQAGYGTFCFDPLKYPTPCGAQLGINAVYCSVAGPGPRHSKPVFVTNRLFRHVS
jgi:hypothetical protein